MMSHIAKLTAVFLVILTVGITPMSAEDPANAPLPDRPGVYYESEKGLVALPGSPDPGNSGITTKWREAVEKTPVRATDTSFILFLDSSVTQRGLSLAKVSEDYVAPRVSFTLTSLDESRPIYRLAFSGTFPPGTYAILRPGKAEPGSMLIPMDTVLVFAVKR